MKNFRLLSMTALVVFSMLTACSSDDDSGPTQDCFDCVVEGQTSTYCYTTGDDFYTVTSGDQEIEVDLMEGQTWAQTKQGLQMICN